MNYTVIFYRAILKPRANKETKIEKSIMYQNCIGQIPTTTPSNDYESNAVKFFFKKISLQETRKQVAEKLRTSRTPITFLRKFLVGEQNVP